MDAKQGIIYRMEGVHSIDFQKIMGSSSGSNYDCRLGLMDIKAQLDETEKEYLDRIDYILNVIDNIPVTPYKVIIWKAYVQGTTVTSIANDLLVSPDCLLKELKVQINEALKKTADLK